MRVDAVEARILGSLIEKQLTTPQQYPLTLNALTLACNQTSNRSPVVSYSEAEVSRSLDTLKEKGLVRFVLPSHGRSVVRFRHVMDERLALDGRQMALIAVMLLRGPQTVGELRIRTERMAQFDSVEEVEADLHGLTRGEEPYVRRLDRRPGQKEERWMQLLCEDENVELSHHPYEGLVGPAPAGAGSRLGEVRSELHLEVAELREEVAALREEINELKAAVLGL